MLRLTGGTTNRTGMVRKASPPETLAEYILRVMRDKSLTYQDVERQSHNKIRPGHLHDIVQGRTQNPTVKTLRNLAIGLGVPESELFAVARGQSPDDDPQRFKGRFETMVMKFSGLPTDRQEELASLIALLDREIDRLSNK